MLCTLREFNPGSNFVSCFFQLVLERWRGGFQPTTLHSEFEDLNLNERLLLADFARIQTVLSGDDMFTVIDSLYDYMRNYWPICDYDRFCELARMSYYWTLDEPNKSGQNDMVYNLYYNYNIYRNHFSICNVVLH